MPSTKQKLRLAGGFAALAALALAASCTGFFQNPTVSTITVDPPNPTVGFGQGATNQQMTAVATYSDGSTGNLSGGTSCTGSTVCWSSSDPTVATITTGGVLAGVSAGTATITAASGAVTGTTTATVAETVSSMTITPSTAAVPDDGVTAATFTITGTTSSGTQNISSLVTLSPSQNGTAATNITCTPGTDNQTCIAESGSVTTQEVYTITVTYGGYTGSAVVSATLTVNPT
jgi:Bacterial Ig-like domain (group 2)